GDTSLRSTLQRCEQNRTPNACQLMVAYGDVVRSLRARYPNLQLIFFNSRTFGGWHKVMSGNPEPYCYESGLAMKWAIEAQIAQEGGGAPNPVTGDLSYPGLNGADAGVGAWIGWSVYNWAQGLIPRSDALMWPEIAFDPAD